MGPTWTLSTVWVGGFCKVSESPHSLTIIDKATYSLYIEWLFSAPKASATTRSCEVRTLSSKFPREHVVVEAFRTSHDGIPWASTNNFPSLPPSLFCFPAALERTGKHNPKPELSLLTQKKWPNLKLQSQKPRTSHCPNHLNLYIGSKYAVMLIMAY